MLVRGTPSLVGDGEGFSVGVVAKAGGGFAIGNKRGFPREAEEISFCIKPGKEGEGGYKLELRFEASGSDQSVDVIDVAAPAGNGWRCQTLEIGGKVRAFINRNKWDKITFQDRGQRSTFYLNDITVTVPPGVQLESPPEAEEDDEEENQREVVDEGDVSAREANKKDRVLGRGMGVVNTGGAARRDVDGGGADEADMGAGAADEGVVGAVGVDEGDVGAESRRRGAR